MFVDAGRAGCEAQSDQIRSSHISRTCHQPPSSGDSLFVHNGLTNRRQSNACQFQVLKAKRYANDGDEAQQCRQQMANGQPQSGKDKPDDVAHQTQTAGSDVILSGQGFAADRLFAKMGYPFSSN